MAPTPNASLGRVYTGNGQDVIQGINEGGQIVTLLSASGLTPGGGTVNFNNGVTGILPVINGGTGLSTSIPLGAIDSRENGAKWDTQFCYGTAVTITNSSKQVSCSTANFTSADIGKEIFGTNVSGGVNQNYQGIVILPRGTITAVINSTTVMVSNAATGSSSGTNGALAWGTNDDAAFTAADAALAALPGCGTLVFPQGATMISQPHFNSMSTACQQTSTGISFTTDYSNAYIGQGPGSTLFVVEPNFNFAGCTHGTGSNGCFFTVEESILSNFGMTGLGNGATGTNAVVLVNTNFGVQIFNCSFSAFCGSDSSTSNYGLGLGTGTRAHYLAVDGWGRNGIYVSGGAGNYCYYCFYGDNLGIPLVIQNSTSYYDYGGQMGGTGGTIAIQVNNGSTARFFGSNFFGGTAANGTGLEIINGTVYLFGCNFDLSSGTTTNGVYDDAQSNSILYASGSVIGGSFEAVRFANGIFFDLGGNTFKGGASSSIIPTCSSTGFSQSACAGQAGSTNESGVLRITAGAGASATGTITLTFVNSFSGASGAAPTCTFQYSNTGTGTWASPVAPVVASASTSAVVVNWGQSAPTNGDTYDIVYNCVAK